MSRVVAMKRTGWLATAALSFAGCQDSPDLVGPPPEPAVSSAAIAPLIVAAPGSGVPGQYIVVFNEAVMDVPRRASQLTQAHGGTLRFAYRYALKGFAAQLSDAAVQALRRTPGVAYIEQDQIVRAVDVETDATWGIDRVDQIDLPLSTTYEYNADGTGVKVYIIDTGIRFDHAEFGGRAVTGIDVETSGGTAADCNGHGTHVAGTVGGTIYGVAKKVSLVAVRVLDCNGSGLVSGVIQGLDWLIGDHRAGQPAAANMSLASGPSPSLDAAVVRAIADGVTVGVAAGNENWSACQTSPARAGPALTVGSTTITDARSPFSNRGTCLDLFAPGSSITSAWHTGTTATNTISGTSMAAPHLVGAAALYLQTKPAATPADVEAALESGATPNRLADAGAESPNLLLYTAFIGAGPLPARPAAPSNLQATAVDHQQINLTWSDNSNSERGFELQRSPDGGVTFIAIANLGANIVSYSNTALQAVWTYHYRIRARNTGGSSTFSNTVIATTKAPPSDRPPVARYTWRCAGPNGRTCSFDATSSRDDRGISSYTWTFGDGAAGTGAKVSRRYGSSGRFNVRLTISDAANQRGTRTCAVSTGTSGNCPP